MKPPRVDVRDLTREAVRFARSATLDWGARRPERTRIEIDHAIRALLRARAMVNRALRRKREREVNQLAR